MKSKYVFLILSLISLSLFGCSNQREKEPRIKSKISSEQKEASNEREVQKEVEEVSTNEKINSMLNSLEQGFSNFFNIEYIESEKAFILTAKEEGPIYFELEELSKNPKSEEANKKIKELSESLVGFSESISKSLDKEQKIILINNFNDLGNFFEMKDGEITYPITKTEE